VSSVLRARRVTLNPRGLGAGRFSCCSRQTPSSYGRPDNRGGAVFDLNSIPTEAIAGIDFLKDGASAIYGTDAIAGVMTSNCAATTAASRRRDVWQHLGHDTGTRSRSLLTGETTAKGSYLVNLNWFKQKREFFAETTIARSHRLPPAFVGKGRTTTVRRISRSTSRSTAAQRRCGVYQWRGVLRDQRRHRRRRVRAWRVSRSPARIRTPANANRYDFAPTTQLRPTRRIFRDDQREARTHGHRARSARLLTNKNQTGIVYTPISINSQSITNADGLVSLTIPANNPYNPFGVV